MAWNSPGVGSSLMVSPRPNGTQVVCAEFLFLGRWAFVHTKQARVLALRDEVGTADVGRQHGLFNHPVSHVAHTRHDFFNAPVFVADDLGFGGFEVDGTALQTGLQQRAGTPVQVEQIAAHARSAWPPRVRAYCPGWRPPRCR